MNDKGITDRLKLMYVGWEAFIFCEGITLGA